MKILALTDICSHIQVIKAYFCKLSSHFSSFIKINKHIPGLVHKVMSEIQHVKKERLYNVGNIIIN